MKLRNLSVRHRLILNNIIMVFVPVLLLIIIGSTVFYGLRATGNFREREIELLWPEAGNSVPVLMGLSHIFTNVDGGERESLGRHVASMEAAGIEVAVVRDGEVAYETVPQQARSLIAESYRLAPSTGNVLRWDEDGLVYRYVSQDGRSIGVALGVCPTVSAGASFRHIWGSSGASSPSASSCSQRPSSSSLASCSCAA